MYDMEELMEELKVDLCREMYNKTCYYNSYSGKMYDGMHYENHKAALLHHLVDIRMLLLNRGIKLDAEDDDINLPFIESILVDSLPVKFAVEDKVQMVEDNAEMYGVEISFARKIHKELFDILETKIGLSTLVFTGWLDNHNKYGYYIVVSEIF